MPLMRTSLVDGAEGVSLAVGQDALGLGGPDAGQERQQLGRGRVQVDGAVDRLAGRARGSAPDRHHEQDADEQPHVPFSGAAARRCLRAR